MATTNNAAIQVELAHNRALEIVRELGGEANVERLEYLDGLGGHLTSVNSPAQLSSAQSVLIVALAEIVQQQERRIAALEPVAAADPDDETAAAGNERPVLSDDLAQLLANAGYADDQAVREASDGDLLKIKGVGPAKLEEIRAATAAEEA